MIIVCSLRAAPEQVALHRPKKVISILAPPSEHPNFEQVVGQDHLRLTFHDVAAITPGLSAPGAHDMQQLLGFIRGWDRSGTMLVHCWAGISRSTAAAYIACCLLQPKGDEFDLAEGLRQASASATPNPMLVAMADEALGREGRMIRAIRNIGRGADAFEGGPFLLPVSK